MSTTFTRFLRSGLHVLDDVAHGLAQVLVVLHVPFHGLEGVDDGGVIAAGEFPADLFHAHAGDLPQDVDGHTAGRGHIGVALGAADVGRGDVYKRQLSACLNGTVVPLAEVKDEAFASGALGDGIAIEPIDGELVALSLIHI